MSVNDACRIIIDDSKVMLHIVASLTDNSRGVIYNGRESAGNKALDGSTYPS
jgi:hypothetical protein